MIACPDCHRLRRPIGLHICLAAGLQRRLELAAPRLAPEEIQELLGEPDAVELFEQLNIVVRGGKN